MLERPAALAVLLGAACYACSSSSASPPGRPDAAPAARSCAIALPALPDAHLTADGTVFRDALGRVVSLRGVDGGGRSKFAPYVPFDYASTSFSTALAAYMDRAASWGIDAMRVPFTWAAVEPVQGQDDEAYLALYDQILDAAWSRGIYTVIDFHQDVYAEAFCGDGFPAWTLIKPPAPHHDCPHWGEEYLNDPDVQGAFDRLWASGSQVQAGMLAMWDRMIARHKDRAGVVGFEIINEPGWGTQSIDAFESGTLTDFFSAVVPHVRAAAPQALVFVDPTGFDGEAAMTFLKKPTGDGIVFAPHYYPLGGTGHPDAVLGGLTIWANVGASWNVPTFVGEFGASNTDPAGPAFMTAHFDALDALGISGTEWEYSVSADSWNMEAYGIVAADGTEYPIAQAIIRPYARAVAGASIAAAYDDASSTYTLSYTPATGSANVTEVAFPSRAFPKGYELGLAGGCFDATTAPGRLLVQSDPDAATVKVTLTPK